MKLRGNFKFHRKLLKVLLLFFSIFQFIEISALAQVQIHLLRPPTALTNPASDVTVSEATLNGKVNPRGFTTTYYFQWGLTTSYGSATPTQSAGDGISDITVSAPVDGLTSNTDYHYRIVATNINGTTMGEDQTIKTQVAPPPFQPPGNLLFLPLIWR